MRSLATFIRQKKKWLSRIAQSGAFLGALAAIAGWDLFAATPTFVTDGAPSLMINLQPVSKVAVAGAKAIFLVKASGTPDPQYQWQRLIAGTWTNLNKTAAACTTAVLTPANSGAQFRVIVSNATGSLTSTTVNLTVYYTIITLQPAPQKVMSPNAATFSVAAIGYPAAMTYQWYSYSPARVVTKIAGANAACFATPATTLNDDKTQYYVVVSNGKKAVTSVKALMTVTPGNPLPWVHVAGSGYVSEFRIDQGNGFIYTEDAVTGLQLSKDFGVTWKSIRGTGSVILPLLVTFAVDPRNHYIYAGDSKATGTNPKMYVSRDTGNTWSIIAGYTPYSTNYVRKIVVAPNGYVIITGHWDGTIFVSTDKGLTCREANQPGTNLGKTAGTSGWGYLGVNPITKEVWAGMEAGGKWVSKDYGLTFTQTVSNFTANTCFGYPGPMGNTYAFGYNLKGETFEGGNHGIWKTSDHGASWTVVQPGTTCMSFLEWDGFATDTLGTMYLSGYDNGNVSAVYSSADGGTTWQPFGAGLPSITAPQGGWPASANCCPAINPCDGKLYIAEYWRGQGGLYRTTGPVQKPRLPH